MTGSGRLQIDGRHLAAAILLQAEGVYELADFRRTEAGYISIPGSGTRIASKAQGSYVTLHTAPLGATEISYTRRG